MIDAKKLWIEDIKMFQRIAKIAESSYEELEIEYDSFINKRKRSPLRVKKMLKK